MKMCIASLFYMYLTLCTLYYSILLMRISWVGHELWVALWRGKASGLRTVSSPGEGVCLALALSSADMSHLTVRQIHHSWQRHLTFSTQSINTERGRWRETQIHRDKVLALAQLLLIFSVILPICLSIQGPPGKFIGLEEGSADFQVGANGISFLKKSITTSIL